MVTMTIGRIKCGDLTDTIYTLFTIQECSDVLQANGIFACVRRIRLRTLKKRPCKGEWVWGLQQLNRN